ncbi:hypothetical protein [Microbacterium phyllosphaerae]|uniref:hypothetical protein n=1 Tax=Microbacterium phyllosphaerae TaxID=124798 RepID=UPI002168C6D9|nr:hypothetical protein [Microbacterium phyllosphaerae]MCS3442819.1 putative anti-sigma-YlaC factor YlaD [Microbacterium phyllosphaerae]
MSQPIEIDAPRNWRATCGRIGWAGLAIATTVVVVTVIEVFLAGVGLALGAGMSGEEAAGIMLRMWITLGVVAAIAVLSIIALRWGLLAASMPVLIVLYIFVNGRLTTAS